MSAVENKALVKRYLEEIENQRNFALMDELFAEDYKHHDPNHPADLQSSRAAYRRLIEHILGVFPDLIGTPEELISEGDKVAVRVTYRGTHLGPLDGIAPTGRRVSFPLLGIWRLVDNKIVEGWIIFNALGMLQQLGVIPAPGRPIPEHKGG